MLEIYTVKGSIRVKDAIGELKKHVGEQLQLNLSRKMVAENNFHFVLEKRLKSYEKLTAVFDELRLYFEALSQPVLDVCPLVNKGKFVRGIGIRRACQELNR